MCVGITMYISSFERDLMDKDKGSQSNTGTDIDALFRAVTITEPVTSVSTDTADANTSMNVDTSTNKPSQVQNGKQKQKGGTGKKYTQTTISQYNLNKSLLFALRNINNSH